MNAKYSCCYALRLFSNPANTTNSEHPRKSVFAAITFHWWFLRSFSDGDPNAISSKRGDDGASKQEKTQQNSCTGNIVTPGGVETPGGDVIRNEFMAAMGAPPEAAASMVPLGRLGNTSDIAEAAAFLLSPRASWVTGQNFHVNGGFSF